MKYLIVFQQTIFFSFFLLFCDSEALAKQQKTVQTRFTRIHYSNDKALSDFTWRISGKRMKFIPDTDLVKRAVDRIFERVSAVLDMYPEDMKIDFYLEPEYDEGYIAYYDNNTKSITVYTDRVTDGVIAHEIAHAIINAYFEVSPPVKMQEILTHYVDKHLWSDY